jgi:hypothetical protein
MVVDINKLVNNAEFTECIEDAAPHRVKIIKEIGPEMKRVQQEFSDLMVEANWYDGKNLYNRYKTELKKDKHSPAADAAKLDYQGWRKGVMKIFRVVLKCIHPNANQIPSISMLYKAGSFLNYINREDLILNNSNYDPDTLLAFKKLEDINTNFKNEDIKNKMINIFIEADAVRKEMCDNADMIKIHYYNKLPDEIRFDGKENKQGIKPCHFGQLVRHEAFKIIKDASKFKKYINTQSVNAEATVYRETIVKNKTEKF